MPPVSSEQSTIVLTERGLTIAGTEEQLNAALSYIDANRSEVEVDYQTALRETQERREYWEGKHRERLAEIAQIPPKPGQEAIHAKLQAWKAKLGLTA